jgi:hypothetical protein
MVVYIAYRIEMMEDGMALMGWTWGWTILVILVGMGIDAFLISQGINLDSTGNANTIKNAVEAYKP